MKKTLLALLAAATIAAPGAAMAEAGKSLVDAERMIAQCFEYAAAQKLTPLSIGVVDASGTLIAFKRQPGASAVTVDAALLKARTSVRLNAPTSVLGPAVADDASARDSFLILQLTTIAGGVPLTDATAQVIGAVGVSGSLPEQDAACAERASETLAAKRR
jgi:uncharacterized protein GlcG (DUF336 family)